MKAHRAGSYSGSIRNGAANRSWVFTFSISAADTWEYKTTTVSGDVAGTWAADNTVGLDVSFAVMAGSNAQVAAGGWSAGSFIAAPGTINGVAATTDTFQITGLVVLPGIELPSASRAPYISRPFDQELLLCSRYYSYNKDREPGFVAANGTSPVFVFNHKSVVPYRAVPTMSIIATALAVEAAPFVFAWTLTNPSLPSINSGHMGTLGGDYQVAGSSASSVTAGPGSPAVNTNANQIRFDARL